MARQLLGAAARGQMLEHPALWLSAPTAAWPPGLPRTAPRLRRVLAADTREPLGHVAVAPGRWWPWPAGPRLAVYEAPDTSLLFTARRVGWLWPVTVVAEADGNAVAAVYGSYVSVPPRRVLAHHRRTAGGKAGAFALATGVVLARWETADGGTLVHFTADVGVEPFVKMGLLAAVLMGG